MREPQDRTAGTEGSFNLRRALNPNPQVRPIRKTVTSSRTGNFYPVHRSQNVECKESEDLVGFEYGGGFGYAPELERPHSRNDNDCASVALAAPRCWISELSRGRRFRHASAALCLPRPPQ